MSEKISIEQIKKAILKVNNGELPYYMENNENYLSYSIKYIGDILCVSSGAFNTSDVAYLEVIPKRVIPFLELLGYSEDDMLYYSEEKHNFFLQLGVSKAKRKGKKIVIYENLS